jgi:hypothetical protein
MENFDGLTKLARGLEEGVFDLKFKKSIDLDSAIINLHKLLKILELKKKYSNELKSFEEICEYINDVDPNKESIDIKVINLWAYIDYCTIHKPSSGSGIIVYDGKVIGICEDFSVAQEVIDSWHKDKLLSDKELALASVHYVF